MSQLKQDSFFTGFHSLAHGLTLIREAKLKRFVLLPLLINCIIFALALMAASHYLGQLSQWLQAWLPHWLAWLSFILWVLLAGFSLVIIYYFFTVLTMLIGSPFNSLLAEKIEHHLTGEYPPSQRDDLKACLLQLPQIMAREWQKICYFLPRGLFVFIMCFVPLVQLAAPLAGFVFTAWALSINYLDYAFDNNKNSFDQLRTKANLQRSTVFGFGVAVLLVTLIPIVNLAIMPIAVAAATALVVERKLLTS